MILPKTAPTPTNACVRVDSGDSSTTSYNSLVDDGIFSGSELTFRSLLLNSSLLNDTMTNGNTESGDRLLLTS